MRINFVVNYISINGGWSPWDTRVGGSEEAVIEWSRRLAKYHDVSVFHNGQHGLFEGVKYREHEEYEPGDVTININYPQFKPQGKTIYWTSLTENPDLSDFDAVCYISKYAKENTGIVHKNTFWLPPGYDSEKIYPGDKIPKQCLYASSPDRGLDILLEAWPSVVRAHPDATLLVTYGAEPVDLPNVYFMGEVDEETMNDLYRTSDIWCHPCKGGELYGISGIKAQAAGCIPVIIPTMALAETVKHGYFATKDEYENVLIRCLGEDNSKLRAELAAEQYVDWKESTRLLLEIIHKVV